MEKLNFEPSYVDFEITNNFESKKIQKINNILRSIKNCLELKNEDKLEQTLKIFNQILRNIHDGNDNKNLWKEGLNNLLFLFFQENILVKTKIFELREIFENEYEYCGVDIQTQKKFMEGMEWELGKSAQENLGTLLENKDFVQDLRIVFDNITKVDELVKTYQLNNENIEAIQILNVYQFGPIFKNLEINKLLFGENLTLEIVEKKSSKPNIKF